GRLRKGARELRNWWDRSGSPRADNRDDRRRSRARWAPARPPRDSRRRPAAAGPNFIESAEPEMPLLKRETEVFPQDLFDLPSDVFPWWVAHTRSRREKAVARHLEQNGVPFYLPQRERRVRRGGRTLTSYLPLFGGYVFFRGLSRERLEALRSQFLVGVLAVEAQELLTGELARLRSLQGLGASLALGAPLTPG